MFCSRNFFMMLSVIGVLFLHCDSAFAWTVGGSITSTISNQQVQNAISATVSSVEPNGTTVTICPAGQYVYKCGNYRVGFNWLLSATFPTILDDDTVNVSTNNYYVGNTNIELFDQMRKFFKFEPDDNSTIEYYPDNNNTSLSQAVPETYIRDRELILNSLCHPTTSSISCARCPNDANVEESTVKLDGNNKTISNSWNFHTIADCYMKNFEDSTGSYEYIDSEQNQQTQTCYYTNTNPEALNVLNGTQIGNFVPGLNINITNLEILPTVTIPASNFRTNF